MYLIQLLVPLVNNTKQKFPPEYFNATRDERGHVKSLGSHLKPVKSQNPSR